MTPAAPPKMNLAPGLSRPFPPEPTAAILMVRLISSLRFFHASSGFNLPLAMSASRELAATARNSGIILSQTSSKLLERGVFSVEDEEASVTVSVFCTNGVEPPATG